MLEHDAHIAPVRLFEVMEVLKEQGFDQLSELGAADYLKYPGARDRYGIWYVLLNTRTGERLIVKTFVNDPEPVLASVFPLWKGADWMEREVYDMCGVVFEGHPDLRRILMWEQYREGYPLRKDFPLRGRFSRAEQLRQALSANPEARYSMEELSIADAFEDLPTDMRQRLKRGEQTGE